MEPAPDQVDGNRVWRIRTPAGTFLQKLYYPRKGAWRERLGAGFNALRGTKTSPLAAHRRLTEERALARWRAAGLDVPAVVAPADAGLAPGPYLLMEEVPGALLSEGLRPRGGLFRGERDALLRGFGRSWGHRHRLALDRQDPRLVQEHGTLAHVIVSGERFVTIDLEQAWLPRKSVLAALGKEVAGVLRSLARVSDPEGFEADLDALVDGYGDQVVLGQLVDEVLASPSPWRRALRHADRTKERVTGRSRGTYATTRTLAERLQRG